MTEITQLYRNKLTEDIGEATAEQAAIFADVLEPFVVPAIPEELPIVTLPPVVANEGVIHTSTEKAAK